jgi:hypothetical protein
MFHYQRVIFFNYLLYICSDIYHNYIHGYDYPILSKYYPTWSSIPLSYCPIIWVYNGIIMYNDYIGSNITQYYDIQLIIPLYHDIIIIPFMDYPLWSNIIPILSHEKHTIWPAKSPCSPCEIRTETETRFSDEVNSLEKQQTSYIHRIVRHTKKYNIIYNI